MSPAMRILVIVFVIAVLALGALVVLSANNVHLLRHTLPGHIIHYLKSLF